MYPGYVGGTYQAPHPGTPSFQPHPQPPFYGAPTKLKSSPKRLQNVARKKLQSKSREARRSQENALATEVSRERSQDVQGGNSQSASLLDPNQIFISPD